jgi:16S rRNA (uracil1498-N3)-methyltransferase
MQLFYQEDLNENSKEVFFDKEESRHIVKVLRQNEGDRISITNGKGLWFQAELKSTHPKNCYASILDVNTQRNLPYQLHMAVAPTKNNDRYEWFLEKATEIGVTSITPIICEHSERTIIKPERFEKILESAMKQSLSAYKPILHPALSFKAFLQQNNFTGQKYIAHCEDQPKQHLGHILTKKEDSLILIGPEGDFSTHEIDMATNSGYLAVTLGERRLRTETAALTAVQIVSYVNLL